MLKRIISLGLFLFCMISAFLFAGGQSEAELRKELKEEHNITTFPIAQTTKSIEYVFTGENTIIRTGIEQEEALTEYNLQTQETRSIYPQMEWNGRRIGSIMDLYYDHTANVLHAIVREHLPEEKTTVSLYYLLNLDDDLWEEIPELRGLIFHSAYVPGENLLYIYPMHGEDILVFDMKSREFVEQIDLLGEATQVYAMYGNPLQILGRTRNEGEFQYYLFDTGTRTGQVFPNVEFISEGISLEYFTHIDGQRFLCLNRQKQYESEIIELDLGAGTQMVVALKSFPRELFFLQRVDDTHYSFLTRSDDNWVILCIMEYH